MRLLAILATVLALCFGAHAQEALDPPATYNCGLARCSITFDPTSMGGDWSCYGAVGSCGPGIARHFDAACAGGTTDTATALANWWAYGHSLGTSLAKLRVPPGQLCGFGTNQSLVCDTIKDDPATLIRNAYIWGYGTSWDRMQLGGNGFRSDNVGQGFSSALIDEAFAGATSVRVIDGHVGIFAVGDWVIVTGLPGQGSGFGPTHQYHEHRQITAISGNTMTFADAVTQSYKATYPNFNTYNAGQGGPAQIYRMSNCFDTTVTYAGLTLTTPASNVQNNMTGRSVTLKDMTVHGSIGPGGLVEGHVIGGYYATWEMDKDNDLFTFDGAYVHGNIAFQSASTTPASIANTRVNGSIVGTPDDLTIKNSVIVGDLQVGATCCGMSTRLTLDTVHYGNGRPAGQEIAKNSLHYNGAGIFSISLGAYQTSPFPGLFVPGHKYFFGDSHGDNTCTPLKTFTVREVVHVDDGTVQIQTDLTGSLPKLSCGDGLDYSTYARYALMRLNQTNVTYGSNALTWNSKVLAPP